jgi:hypothetical protein
LPPHCAVRCETIPPRGFEVTWNCEFLTLCAMRIGPLLPLASGQTLAAWRSVGVGLPVSAARLRCPRQAFT